MDTYLKRNAQKLDNKGIQFPRLYDLLIAFTTRGMEKKYRQNLINLADIQPGHRVLDIGCGTGSFAVAAWKNTQPGGAVNGVDVSSKMLRLARKKNLKANSAVEFSEQGATSLPFQNETFDIVTMITVLHAIPTIRRRECFSEMIRVLRPTGHILIVDFAGDLKQRNHWIATHGPHGNFNLYDLQPQLIEPDLKLVNRGELKWMDLGYITLQKTNFASSTTSS